jgi:hypothetical protein
MTRSPAADGARSTLGSRMSPPNPLGLITGPLRSVLGLAQRAETDVERHTPLHEALELEDKLEQTIVAVHRSADAMERHVVVVETLAESVPALTEAVTRLTNELNGLLGVIAPIASAEREVSRIEHLLGRRRHGGEPPRAS